MSSIFQELATTNIIDTNFIKNIWESSKFDFQDRDKQIDELKQYSQRLSQFTSDIYMMTRYQESLVKIYKKIKQKQIHKVSSFGTTSTLQQFEFQNINKLLLQRQKLREQEDNLLQQLDKLDQQNKKQLDAYRRTGIKNQSVDLQIERRIIEIKQDLNDLNTKRIQILQQFEINKLNRQQSRSMVFTGKQVLNNISGLSTEVRDALNNQMDKIKKDEERLYLLKQQTLNSENHRIYQDPIEKEAISIQKSIEPYSNLYKSTKDRGTQDQQINVLQKLRETMETRMREDKYFQDLPIEEEKEEVHNEIEQNQAELIAVQELKKDFQELGIDNQFKEKLNDLENFYKYDRFKPMKDNPEPQGSLSSNPVFSYLPKSYQDEIICLEKTNQELRINLSSIPLINQSFNNNSLIQLGTQLDQLKSAENEIMKSIIYGKVDNVKTLKDLTVLKEGLEKEIARQQVQRTIDELRNQDKFSMLNQSGSQLLQSIRQCVKILRHIYIVDANVFQMDYDPSIGFVVRFDVIQKLPTRYKSVKIGWGLFNEGTEPKFEFEGEKHKLTPQNEFIGNSFLFEKYNETDITPSDQIILYIRVWGYNPMIGDNLVSTNIGWTIVRLFSETNQLNFGKFKIPIYSDDLKPTTKVSSVPYIGDAKLFLRVCIPNDPQIDNQNSTLIENQYIIPAYHNKSTPMILEETEQQSTLILSKEQISEEVKQWKINEYRYMNFATPNVLSNNSRIVNEDDFDKMYRTQGQSTIEKRISQQDDSNKEVLRKVTSQVSKESELKNNTISQKDFSRRESTFSKIQKEYSRRESSISKEKIQETPQYQTNNSKIFTEEEGDFLNQSQDKKSVYSKQESKVESQSVRSNSESRKEQNIKIDTPLVKVPSQLSKEDKQANSISQKDLQQQQSQLSKDQNSKNFSRIDSQFSKGSSVKNNLPDQQEPILKIEDLKILKEDEDKRLIINIIDLKNVRENTPIIYKFRIIEKNNILVDLNGVQCMQDYSTKKNLKSKNNLIQINQEHNFNVPINAYIIAKSLQNLENYKFIIEFKTLDDKNEILGWLSVNLFQDGKLKTEIFNSIYLFDGEAPEQIKYFSAKKTNKQVSFSINYAIPVKNNVNDESSRIDESFSRQQKSTSFLISSVKLLEDVKVNFQIVIEQIIGIKMDGEYYFKFAFIQENKFLLDNFGKPQQYKSEELINEQQKMEIGVQYDFYIDKDKHTKLQRLDTQFIFYLLNSKQEQIAWLTYKIFDPQNLIVSCKKQVQGLYNKPFQRPPFDEKKLKLSSATIYFEIL